MEEDTPTDGDLSAEMMLLLTRYSTEVASDAERAEVEAWITSGNGNPKLVNALLGASKLMEHLPREYDSTQGWRRVAQRTGIGPGQLRSMSAVPTLSPTAPLSPHHRPRIVSFDRGALRRVAATLAFVLLSGGIVYQLLHRTSPTFSSAPTIAETTTGEVREILLPDGTRVTVGPESRIRYVRGEDGVRQVDLEGMAIFDVERVANEPFLVRTRETVTRVLGTRFLVRAYESEDQVRVSVERGSVMVVPAASDSTSGDILGPGDVAEIVGDAPVSVNRDATSHKDTDWAEGLLTFEQEPLPAVIAELERWYEAEIELGDSSLTGRRLTITLHRGPLEEALLPISLTLDARVERHGDVYVLLPEDSGPEKGPAAHEENY